MSSGTNSNRPHKRHRLNHRAWGFGFLFSCLFAWVCSAIFFNSVPPLEWDPAIQRYNVTEGTQYRHRSEGWATTTYGNHGMVKVHASPAATQNEILIWGDSFAEALQVEDSLKPAQLATTMLQKSGHDTLMVRAAAFGGTSAADFIFLMPRYVEALGNVRLNVILLVGMDDVLPGRSMSPHAQFYANPPRVLPPQNSVSRLAPIFTPYIDMLELSGFYHLYSDLRSIRLRFSLGPQSTHAETNRPDFISKPPLKSWHYLLTRLRQASNVPLAVLYCPKIPILTREGLKTSDPDAALRVKFSKICEQTGIDFIDTTSTFAQLYDRSAHLPYGFINGRVGSGHMNKYGNRLVAQGLLQYIEKKKAQGSLNAFLAD